MTLHRQHPLKSLTTLSLIAALAIGLSACAPEPGDAGGSTDKDKETINPETEWGGAELPEDERQTELPEGFPSEAFALPDGAVIYNAGEREEDQWFVVLLANDESSAEKLWEQIISTNGFEVSDESQTVEGGRIATLSSDVLSVQALTTPGENGSVLLSYDLLRWADATG